MQPRKIFPHHLDVLRERMLHPTDYELAVNYFLEEFAGDVAFVRGSEPEQMPHLVAVLNVVFSKAMGRHVEVENALVSYLREHRFVHGNARVAGRIVLFFYFEDADTGLLMLIPGIRGQMEVARFHLKGGLPDRGGIEDQPSLPMARKECMNIGTRPKLLQEVPSL